MAPGVRSNFDAPMFESELFRKQIHYIEESTCDILGAFRRPGNCAPLPSHYAPGAKDCSVGLTTHPHTTMVIGVGKGEKRAFGNLV